MGESTAIGWTDHSFNPWWGCTNVSPGCDHCYAETFAKRTGHHVWGHDGDRRMFGDKHWAEPLRWNAKAEAAGERRRVFCASMADVFEDHPALGDPRHRLWQLIEATPQLDWLLLTKRPQNVLRMVPPAWVGADEHGMVQVDPTHLVPLRYLTAEERARLDGAGWPANVWVGTTVENQRYADLRIPQLLEIPAPVRFLSCEPLLGPVDLGIGDPHRGHDSDDVNGAPHHRICLTCSDPDGEHDVVYFRRDPSENPGIDWVIAGGESGPHHRPLDLDWARALRDECVDAGVAFFFKQVGGRTPTAGGDLLDGVQWKQFPTPRTTTRSTTP